MNRKRWIALAVAVALLVISVGIQISASVATSEDDDFFSTGVFGETVIEEGSPADKIAVISLNGVIEDTGQNAFGTSTYNHKRFLRAVESAGKDPFVSGIILRVNTPGGGVVESDEIHDQIVKVQEEYDKPVYVSMGNMAASGGYYVSAPANKIIAHPSTLTGSIGVIMQGINIAELADDLGIDFTTLKSGDYKDIMSSTREMTEDEETILQEMVDDMYGEFVQVIADGRDMSEETVREIGDGRIYTGKQAYDLELVDDLGDLNDTIQLMKEDQQLADAQVIEYTAPYDFANWFGMQVKQTFGSDPDYSGLIELLRENNAPRAMYLYSE